MPRKRNVLDITKARLWYLVGLVTSDGNLSKDRRHIDITSKDYAFLNNLKTWLSIPNEVTAKNKKTVRRAYRIQIANKNFYDFLLSIGLTPNKSLTLREIRVPGKAFPDFMRGIIDGDGCIQKWVHASNGKEQWSLRVYSGSINFIGWLKNKVEIILKAKGQIYLDKKKGAVLKYGKMAAREILKKCYYKGCFALERKKVLAQRCIKACVKWNKSNTICQFLKPG